MFIRRISEGNSKLCLFKEGNTREETEHNIKNKIIENNMILICGVTGSGKSVFANLIAYLLKKLGYTIVYITEKESFELYNAFGILPITADYHIKNLMRQGLSPIIDDFKIYHAITFNMPFKEKLPPINWFSFSIKDVHSYGFSVMMTGDVDKQTVRVCESTKKQLDKNDNIWTFLEKVYKRIKAQDFDLFSYDPEDMFLPIKTIGTEKTLSDIKDGISDFRHHFFLQPEDSKYNLDMIEVLNDNKHTHLFSTKWIPEKKIKQFCTLEIAIKIDKALGSGKVKHPVCVMIEEAENEFPESKKTNFEEITCKFFINLMRRIRQKGMVVSTSQNYFSTDKDFRKACNQKFLGILSKEDKQTLAKDFYYLWKKDQMDALGRLGKGQFVWWEEVERTEIASIIQAHLPPFANAEEGEDFIEKYREFYPEKCVQNYKIYNEIKELRDSIEKERKLLLKEMEKSERQKAKEREEAKQKKTEELKEEVKKVKEESKYTIVEILGKDSYNKRKVDLKSWGKIGKETGKNIRTSRKYAFAYARIIRDEEFIEKELSMLKEEEKEDIKRFMDKSVQKDEESALGSS